MSSTKIRIYQKEGADLEQAIEEGIALFITLSISVELTLADGRIKIIDGFTRTYRNQYLAKVLAELS